MSRSATPAFRRAATTVVIRVAFCCMAALAVAAWVTTPAEILAISGARRTSPSALTSIRFPVPGTGGWPTSAPQARVAGATGKPATGGPDPFLHWTLAQNPPPSETRAHPGSDKRKGGGGGKGGDRGVK